MKMIVAIIQEADLNALLETLARNGLSATKLASTGGFLRRRNTTLLIGAREEQVSSALGCIESVCKSRTLVLPSHLHSELPERILPEEVVVGGATVFLLNIEQFLHL